MVILDLENSRIEALLSRIRYWKEFKNLYPADTIVAAYGKETKQGCILKEVNKKIDEAEQEVSELITKKKETKDEL